MGKSRQFAPRQWAVFARGYAETFLEQLRRRRDAGESLVGPMASKDIEDFEERLRLIETVEVEGDPTITSPGRQESKELLGPLKIEIARWRKRSKVRRTYEAAEKFMRFVENVMAILAPRQRIP